MGSVSFILRVKIEIRVGVGEKIGEGFVKKTIEDSIKFMIFILFEQYIIKSRIYLFLKGSRKKG